MLLVKRFEDWCQLLPKGSLIVLSVHPRKVSNSFVKIHHINSRLSLLIIRRGNIYYWLWFQRLNIYAARLAQVDDGNLISSEKIENLAWYASFTRKMGHFNMYPWLATSPSDVKFPLTCLLSPLQQIQSVRRSMSVQKNRWKIMRRGASIPEINTGLPSNRGLLGQRKCQASVLFVVRSWFFLWLVHFHAWAVYWIDYKIDKQLTTEVYKSYCNLELFIMDSKAS